MFKFLIAPKFWRERNSKIAKCLSPFSKIFSLYSDFRSSCSHPTKADVPVICVGNAVLGGAGKTPTVEYICNLLKERMIKPHILTSGYGGYLKNVVRVDPAMHSYLQVGDEALLSAAVTTTWVGRNRTNSAKAAVIAGADMLVMDDGFQNNSIHKDLKILVVDSKQAFGNEYVFPAGPLREGVEISLAKSDMVIVIGDKNEELEKRIADVVPSMKICRAKMIPTYPDIETEKIIGFCGIGFPDKFKKTLLDSSYYLLDFIVFSDHHPYTITEVQKLIDAAKKAGATLVTTTKDYIKIPEVFRSYIKVIPIKLKFEDAGFDDEILSLTNQTING